MAIKAVGFDYGGVIGGIRTGNTTFGDDMCRILDIDKQTFKDSYFEMNHLINLGEIPSWREFWKQYLEKLDMSDKLDEVLELSDSSIKHLKVVDERMIELIDTIRANGYKTGLLSNTTLEGAADQRKLGIAAHFDVYHASAETKLMKPDPRAFESLAQDLGVNMNELVFIDDADKSLSSADEVGFIPIKFENYEQLKLRLTELSII